MLTVFRRHLTTCKHAKKGRSYRSCGCPLYVEGILHGEQVRKSLDVRSWEAGQKLVRDWEVHGLKAVVSLSFAYERFISHHRANGTSKDMIRKHEKLGEEMVEFLGDMPMRGITVNDLSRFRESWTVGPTTSKNTIERMRSFFKFCVERDWIEKNPAKLIKPPKILLIERKPFEPEEIEKIDQAIDQFPNWGIYGEMNRERLRAFVAVLKWTGMRIGDAVQLSKDKVVDGHITLRTTKNNKRVAIPVHPEIAAALKTMGKIEQFFFWSGCGSVKSQVSCWERTFKRLSKIAKVRVFAHGFRHTLIVNLLSKGIPISEVAMIVGNSPRIIERHYNHHIKSRQDALDKAVMGTW